MKWKRLILLVVLPFLFFYTYVKLLELFEKKVIAFSFTFGVFGFLIAFQMAFMLSPKFSGHEYFWILSWINGILLSIWSVGFILFGGFDLLMFGLSFFASPFQASRRDFLRDFSLNTLICSFGFPLGISLLGLRQALRGPVVRKIPIAGPPFMKGFKLVQISDLHVGQTIQKGYVTRVVECINALDADAVAMTGDLADGLPEELEAPLSPLKHILSKNGVYYVTGNHAGRAH